VGVSEEGGGDMQINRGERCYNSGIQVVRPVPCHL